MDVGLPPREKSRSDIRRSEGAAGLRPRRTRRQDAYGIHRRTAAIIRTELAIIPRGAGRPPLPFPRPRRSLRPLLILILLLILISLLLLISLHARAFSARHVSEEDQEQD